MKDRHISIGGQSKRWQIGMVCDHQRCTSSLILVLFRSCIKHSLRFINLGTLVDPSWLLMVPRQKIHRKTTVIIRRLFAKSTDTVITLERVYYSFPYSRLTGLIFLRMGTIENDHHLLLIHFLPVFAVFPFESTPYQPHLWTVRDARSPFTSPFLPVLGPFPIDSPQPRLWTVHDARSPL